MCPLLNPDGSVHVCPVLPMDVTTSISWWICQPRCPNECVTSVPWWVCLSLCPDECVDMWTVTNVLLLWICPPLHSDALINLFTLASLQECTLWPWWMTAYFSFLRSGTTAVTWWVCSSLYPDEWVKLCTLMNVSTYIYSLSVCPPRYPDECVHLCVAHRGAGTLASQLTVRLKV